MSEWCETDPDTPEKLKTSSAGNLLDLRTKDGEEYPCILAEHVIWKEVSFWRQSRRQEFVGNRELEELIDGPMDTGERSHIVAKLDEDIHRIFQETGLKDQMKTDIRRALATGVVSPELRRFMDKNRLVNQFQTKLREAGEKAYGADHDHDENCPVCRLDEQMRSEELMEFVKTRREELEKLEVLVRTTPEMLRWARLFAGTVLAHTEKDPGKKMLHAMTMLTGEADEHPLVKGAIETFACLLRDDVDFAVFRREKLEGRSPRVNSSLHAAEQKARAMIVVRRGEKSENS